MRIEREGTAVRAAAGLGVLIAVQLVFVSFGLPGRRTVSDVLFVIVPAISAGSCFHVARRLSGRDRFSWAGLGVMEVLWAAANVIWAWYELVLRREVPTPSPADWLYSAALVVALVAVVAALLPLVFSTSGAMRSLLDVLLVSGALLFLVWVTLIGPMLTDERADFVQTVTWLYPALGVTVSTVAFATMARVRARSRLPWLIVGAAFLTGSMVDSVWAYANVTGGFVAGSMFDPLWVLAYGAVGVAATTVRGDGGLISSRMAPGRWESLGAYVPVTAAVVATYVQNLHGQVSETMITVGLGLVGLLLARQVLAILENHTLARSLESRVAEATSGLRASEEHFRSIVASISDVVLILDERFAVRYQSPAAGRLLGYTDDELVGRTIDDFAHPDDLDRARRSAPEGGLLTPGGSGVHVGRVRRAGGEWCHMEATVTDLLDHPEVHGIVLALRDVGERVELTAKLRHQAFHDALTGLVNRAYLYQELDLLLAAGRRPTLLLIDLDEFKAVNDTAGHDLGDDVLVTVATRLLASTRPGDVVSRLGGDEFAIIVQDDPRTGTGSASAIADRILEALRQPSEVQGRQVRCFGSIGVAVADGHETAGALLRDADTAMYQAKARGKGRVEVFTVAMRDDVVRRQRITELLRRSVAEHRLELLYQPIVDLAADRFAGAEALLRLRGDGGELVSPVEFVPIAEETGLIVEIGAWVLVEACRQAVAWQDLRPDGPPLDIAVNISTRQLQDRALACTVQAALDAVGLDPALLILEITEGALGAADPDVDATLLELRRLGVRLSIDDFGAGYSSLSRLRDLPVDELKIDRSFVADLGGGHDAPLVDAILAMAHRLGLSVTAEGIETDGQSEYFRSRAERGQGFLYARPLPPGAAAIVLAGSPAEARERTLARAR